MQHVFYFLLLVGGVCAATGSSAGVTVPPGVSVAVDKTAPRPNILVAFIDDVARVSRIFISVSHHSKTIVTIVSRLAVVAFAR